MKKTITYSMLAFIWMIETTLTSCEKFAPEDLETGTTQHDANANVIIRVQNPQNSFSRLSLAIFQGQEKVKVIHQTTENTGFGKLSINLEEGEYRFVAIGYNGEKNCTISSPDKIKFANNKLTNTFSYYERFKIEKNKIEKTITPERAVAKIVLDITDQVIPENLQNIEFYYTGGSSTLDAVEGVGCVNSRQTETFSIPKDTRHFEVYTFPKAENKGLKMKITFMDADYKEVEQFYTEDKKPVTVIKDKTTQIKINIQKKEVETIDPNSKDDSSTPINNKGWGVGENVEF